MPLGNPQGQFNAFAIHRNSTNEHIITILQRSISYGTERSNIDPDVSLQDFFGNGVGVFSISLSSIFESQSCFSFSFSLLFYVSLSFFSWCNSLFFLFFKKKTKKKQTISVYFFVNAKRVTILFLEILSRLPHYR